MLAATGCYTDGGARAAGVGPDRRTPPSTATRRCWRRPAKTASTRWRCCSTRGADVNVKNSDGWTPLIKAASANLPDVARVLLKHGADLDVADRLDRTAWMYASMSGREEIAALLNEAKAKK